VKARLTIIGSLVLAACVTIPRDPEAPLPDEFPVVERADEWCKQEGSPAGIPTKPFSTDGCTGWVDGSLYDCCVDHDIAHWCGGTEHHRLAADQQFRVCAEKHSPAQSGLVYYTVRVFGVPWLPTSWRWGYGHRFGSGYADSPSTAPSAP
jgi:hypothetical protein